jgi:hypothetical protein
VRTSVAAVVPLIVTVGAAKAQVGAGVPVPVTAQDILTAPVKPAAGLTLIFVVAEPPPGTVIVVGVALKEKEAEPPPPEKAALPER